MAELTNEQKKAWAKTLYTRETLTQAEIAERVGVSRVTVNNWIGKGNWEQLKASITITREEQLKNLYRQLAELNNAIMGKPEGERFPNAAEADTISKLSNAQIEAIEQSGSVSPLVEIKANVSGIVMTKRVNQGDYVASGAVLFDIANLSNVWAMFDAFEVDLPFLNRGDQVHFTLQALPGKTYTGRIAFIDPIINPSTRTARVRVEVPNSHMELKPEMYATAEVSAPLQGYKDRITVPQTAVLWTGKRSIVYVKQPDTSTPTFLMREVELGPSLGNAYVILKGLSEGEEVVTNDVFSIDASAQLEGKQSMMNNDGEAQPMSGHVGHTMSGHEGYAAHGTSAAQPEPAGEHAMFGVKGSCDMCKQRIETAAKSVNGVSSAHWDKEKQMIHLQNDPSKTSVDAISKAIAKAGHDTDTYKADQAVYDQLPGCCKYRQ